MDAVVGGRSRLRALSERALEFGMEGAGKRSRKEGTLTRVGVGSRKIS